jgi:thiamine pyrophosphokinase
VNHDLGPVVRAVVVAHGELGGEPGWEGWATALLDAADLVVAADGGAAAVLRLGRYPHVVVGDLDSLHPSLRATLAEHGSRFEAHPRDKDQTDTELALQLACARGATPIVIAGALGGPRLDHALANVLLLALPELADRDVRIADPRHEVRLLRGPARLTLGGQPGDLLTLLPLTPLAAGITTQGLRYALNDGALALGRSRGVSNEFESQEPTIALRDGLLLVVVHHQAPAVAPVPHGARQRSGRPGAAGGDDLTGVP